MVFIDKVKEIVKSFEESTRKDIGIALLAYEEFISKGLKTTDKDLDRLEKIFNYYDETCSNDYPSLTNEVLQDCNTLICNANDFEKDGYKFHFDYLRKDTSTSFVIEVSDSKTGFLESELRYEVVDNSINSNYGKDSFNTMNKACEKVKLHIQNMNIDEIVKSYKL